MAKIGGFNWKGANKMVNTASRRRLLAAAEVVAAEVRTKLRIEIGKDVKKTGISRPRYKTGKVAGQDWTQRNFGSLLSSVRVVEKKEAWGFEIGKARNVRIYVGHYMAYYAQIFEYTRPFMRPAWRAALSRVKSVIQTGAAPVLVSRSFKGMRPR